MKIRIRLSIWVIAIMIVVVTGVSVMLLRRAASISMDLNKRSIGYLAHQQAEYWKGREDSNIRLLRTLANVMGDYESLPAAERRNRFDDMMQSVIQQEAEMYQLYTVWKPNAVDGTDSRYIGRTGSTETGQYGMSFIKENGKITSRVTSDVADAMAFLTGPNARKDRVDHPVPRKIDGKDTFYVRMMVPIINERTKEIVGGVGSLLKIDAIQNSVMDMIGKYDEITAMSVYSGNGFILGSFKPERVGEMLVDAEIQYGDRGDEITRIVGAGKEFSLRSWAPALKVYLNMTLTPITIGNSDTTWTIMIGASEDFMLLEVNIIRNFTIILAVIAILATAVIIYFVLRKTTEPIIKVTEMLKDISEGEGDLTRAIPENGNDEITDMSRYFNRTLAKIKNMITNIKQQTTVLSNTGHDLAGNMTETASAVNQITANIQSIKGRVINQSASVTETNSTMEQVVANINKLNGYIGNQSEEVSGAASAIDEMITNINAVTNTLVNNADNVNTLKEVSEEGRTGLQNMTADIQGIARESEGLLAINSVMQNIASQTNLLSMNAAIEAAHAGEAGKGFAVVADEIRKLAESSGEQSKMVGSVLKNIKSSIDKITRSGENLLTGFEEIDASVRIVADQEENIRNAMEEQAEKSKKILQSAGNVSEITLLVRNGSQEMLEGSQEVIHESKNLEHATQEITGGMNEMATGAEQINAAVIRVNEISVKNRENIDLLVQEVSKFKVA